MNVTLSPARAGKCFFKESGVEVFKRLITKKNQIQYQQ
jgi:hypothetical protein